MEKFIDTVNCCQHVKDLKLQYTQFSYNNNNIRLFMFWYIVRVFLCGLLAELSAV